MNRRACILPLFGAVLLFLGVFFGQEQGVLALTPEKQAAISSGQPRFADLSGMEARMGPLAAEFAGKQQKLGVPCLPSEEKETKLQELEVSNRAAGPKRIQRLRAVRTAEEAVLANRDALLVTPSIESMSVRGHEIVDELLARQGESLRQGGMPFVSSRACPVTDAEWREFHTCDEATWGESPYSFMARVLSLIRPECQPLPAPFLEMEKAIQARLDQVVDTVHQMSDGGTINALRLPWWISEMLALNDAALELAVLKRALLEKEEELLRATPVCTSEEDDAR